MQRNFKVEAQFSKSRRRYERWVFGKGNKFEVELRSCGPKSNENLTPTDYIVGPQTSFSLILYIGYSGFWQ